MRIYILALLSTAGALAQPALRLNDFASPSAYRAVIDVDPGSPVFQGMIEIDIKVRKPIEIQWLNARDLEVESAYLITRSGARPLKTIPGGDDFIGFSFEESLQGKKITLRIKYRGRIDSERMTGLFRQKEEERWYAFTQFAAVGARRVFPCFDEPGFRARWQITLRVPHGMPAFSNTPELSRVRGQNGFDTVAFKQIAPIPSYLVAFAVGPFETLSGRPAGLNRVPVRVIVPSGRTPDAKMAAESTPEILERIEAYTGTPYPFEKLDSIALPRAFFTAMENPGLVVYRQAALLGDSKEYERICAHELAHQWFGNLVTMRWWNDIWLSEGLATWLAAKVMKESTRMILNTGDTMIADERPNSRRIREPVTDLTNILQIYNQFTYTKAAAVTAMFEEWAGERAFQKAIRRYLSRHAWQSVTTDDFLTTISKAFAKDPAPAWRSFLDQTGVPVISAALGCDGPRPRLKVAQAPPKWIVPYCFRTPKGAQCNLIDGGSQQVKLGPKCPPWFIPNADGAGYYRVDPDHDIVRKLTTAAAPAINQAERAALARDIPALTQTGALPLGDALLLVPLLIRDDGRLILEKLSPWLRSVRNALPPSERPHLTTYLSKSASLPSSEEAAAEPVPEHAEKALAPATSPADALRLLIAMGGYDFVVKHYDELAARLPAEVRAELPRTAQGLCDEDKAKEVEAFFGSRTGRSRSGRRRLDRVTATIRGCAQLRRVQGTLEGVVPRN